MYSTMNKHTTNSRHRETTQHRGGGIGPVGDKAGKAIPTGNTKMNWTEKPKYKGVTGPARKRRTMSNRGQGTGLAGKAGHMGFPKPDKHGYY